MGQEIKTRVVIVGGGTAGWMTAAALTRLLPAACTVRLIESAEIGIVGVGEATLPHLRAFIETLGIDEASFMRATHATYKLGIDFRDFGRPGDTYIHPFDSFGRELNEVGFHHYWLRMQAAGRAAPLERYAPGIVAARANRFALPTGSSRATTFGYAYQFDATRFGPFLRAHAEAAGAIRTEGKVIEVERGPRGVAALVLESGERVEADLFVDCSGFRSLLLGGTLEEPWEDWSRWLPCDRAVAVPCASPPGPIEPYTRATAMPGGWRWRIPLQHRVGNGYVYSSAHLADQDAADALVAALEGEPLAEPRVLRFRAGRRRRSWVDNVVGVGLASGFLEPLESTSIYLVQMAITQLIELFPVAHATDADQAEFNRLVDMEYDRIRDFLILHYHATTRDDSGFWNHVRTMDVPDSLAEKMALFTHAGRVAKYSEGLFLEPSWIAVYLGQGIHPGRWDQRADAPPIDRLARAMDALEREIASGVAAMPDHAAFLAARNARVAAAA